MWVPSSRPRWETPGPNKRSRRARTRLRRHPATTKTRTARPAEEARSGVTAGGWFCPSDCVPKGACPEQIGLIRLPPLPYQHPPRPRHLNALKTAAARRRRPSPPPRLARRTATSAARTGAPPRQNRFPNKTSPRCFLSWRCTGLVPRRRRRGRLIRLTWAQQ